MMMMMMMMMMLMMMMMMIIIITLFTLQKGSADTIVLTGIHPCAAKLN